MLDGHEVQLNQETLIIADDTQPLAIAGVMGGLDSGVTVQTQAVFLESAIFEPHCIARTRQKYNLGSESSHRFERGIDPTLQVEALERATALIVEIAGGKAGPIIDVTQKKYLPRHTTISLRAARVDKILGFTMRCHDRNSAPCICAAKNRTGWQDSSFIVQTLHLKLIY